MNAQSRLKVFFSLVCLSGIVLSARADDSKSDRRAEARRSYGLRSATPIDEKHAELVFGVSLTGAVEKPGSYRIVSYDDPRYAYKDFVKPLSVKIYREREAECPPGVKLNFQKTKAVLEFPFPMKESCTYHVIAQGSGSEMVTGTHCAAEFKYRGAAGKQGEPPRDLEIMGLREIESVGNGLIRLGFGANFNAADSKDPSMYAVKVNGSPARIVNLGRFSRLECYLPVGWPFVAIPQHDIFLQLESPLKDGDLVEVEVSEKLSKASRKISMRFENSSSTSNSIKVNQCGYLTDSPQKTAYLGRWLGSFPELNENVEKSAESSGGEKAFWSSLNSTQETAGAGAKTETPSGAIRSPALKFDTAPEFSVIDEASGKTAFKGQSRLIHESGDKDEGVHKVDHSGENVYELDFSEFRSPGNYHIAVEGVGRSLPFKISDDVYKEAFDVQAKGVFAQRCGIELAPPYSDWRRIACHKNGIALTSQISWKPHSIHDDLPKKLLKQKRKGGNDAKLEMLDKDPSLFAWFKFDGDFKDSSGNGLDMEPRSPDAKFSGDDEILPGNKVYGPTLPGNANGAFRNDVSIDEAKGWTICIWFKKDSNNEFFSLICGLGENKYDSNRYCLYANWGVIEAVAGAKSRSIKFERINDGRWRHLALVLDPLQEVSARSLTIFCDGIEVAKSPSCMPGISGLLSAGGISGNGAGDAFFDDFRIYSRKLSPDELRCIATLRPAEEPIALNAFGGHHDAGDYNPRSHLDVAQKLMRAYEMAPQKFYDGQLNVPEKENGLPDILDEAFWALRLWIDLQDEDGGVRNGTESAGDPNFIQTVELDDKGDYAYAKDAQGSFNFAGAMAQASRLWRMNGKEKEADDFLRRAVMAYDWALKNKPETEGADLFAKVWLDPKAYAAAELLRTTGEERYNKDFLDSSVIARDPKAEMDKYGLYDQSFSIWAYLNCPPASSDEKTREAAKGAIIRRADEFISLCDSMAYKFYRHPYAPITWGTGSYQNQIDPVLWAWRITGDDKYKKWILRSCDNTLGANPMNISYITGLGSRHVLAPLHNSRYGHSGEVAPGMQVQGPNQRSEGYRVAETYYPKMLDNFAILYNFVDCHFAISMNEGVIPTQAQTMAVFGLMLPDAADGKSEDKNK